MCKKIYKNNFLKDVIFRIDFVNPVDINNFVKKNLNELKKNYPLYSPVKAKHDNIKLTPESVEKETIEFTNQIFYNFDRTARIEMNPSCLIINYKKYKDFEPLFKDIELILGLLIKDSDITVGRTGLRYINIFENSGLEKIDWSKYIKENLLFEENWGGFNVLQHMSVANLKKEECLIKVQYGLFNGEMPNDRVKDSYILDIDASSFQMCDLNLVKSQIITWNDSIREVFENSITEEMKDLLNGESTKL